MFIPGPKLTQVFASRWKALFWAGGILVWAYFFIPRQGDEGDNAQAALAVASQLMPGDLASTADDPASPWRRSDH